MVGFQPAVNQSLRVYNYRKHPKDADFCMVFLLPNFADKNTMFNLNESNRIVMAQHPSDMWIGVNGMCGQVRSVGLDPTNGDVYIFVGKSRKIMKLQSLRVYNPQLVS